MTLLDNLDWKILDILQQDSHISSRKIAKKANLPITTVYHRLKRLENEGVIEKYSVVLNHTKLGKTICVYIFLHYDISLWVKNPRMREEFRKNLLALPGIEEIKYITGGYDVLLKARLKDMGELNSILLDRLRKIPGTRQTETFFVLEEVK